MAPPKKDKMPSMKELQELLAALDAEGGLSIGGGENPESANLDDLYEDSYFYAILHKNVKQTSIEVATSPVGQDDTQDQDSNTATAASSTSPSAPLQFEVLSLPQECSWGDDHEAFGSKILVRPGYAAVLAALSSASASASATRTQSIFVATGPSGIGKSCLTYYLAFKLFELGHNIVISDPMFTNAFINKQYFSCYSPHLQKHETIHEAISSARSSPTPTWWICDDGFLPVKGTRCNVLVTSATAEAEVDIATIHKKNRLVLPVQFQIPKWSMDEIKAGLIVSLSAEAGSGSRSDLKITKEQEVVLETVFKKFKGNPKKIFAWVKSNWVVESEPGSGANSGKTDTTKTKSSKAKRA